MQYHRKHFINFTHILIGYILTSLLILTFQFFSFLLYIAAGLKCAERSLDFSFWSCPNLYWTAILYVTPPLFGMWLIERFTQNYYLVMLFVVTTIVFEQILLLKSLGDLSYWSILLEYSEGISRTVF